MPLVPNGSQRYFVDCIAEGLNDYDIHYFVILKGRQLGITTICLAFDLYWNFKHKALQGTLVTHNDNTREFMRDNLDS